jgi:hypothetical protein
MDAGAARERRPYDPFNFAEGRLPFLTPKAYEMTVKISIFSALSRLSQEFPSFRW